MQKAHDEIADEASVLTRMLSGNGKLSVKWVPHR